MQGFLRDFVRDEGGQDIVEHTLLVVVLVAIGICWYSDSGKHLKGLWKPSDMLANARTLVG